MIATIAVIAEKKKVQRSYRNHSPAIAATTIAEKDFLLSQRSLESGFHMIAKIASIADFFCLRDSSDHSDRSDHMETRL